MGFKTRMITSGDAHAFITLSLMKIYGPEWVQEVAQDYGATERTVYRWRADGYPKWMKRAMEDAMAARSLSKPKI